MSNPGVGRLIVELSVGAALPKMALRREIRLGEAQPHERNHKFLRRAGLEAASDAQLLAISYPGISGNIRE